MSSKFDTKTTKFSPQPKESFSNDVNETSLCRVLSILSEANQIHLNNNGKLYDIKERLTGNYEDQDKEEPTNLEKSSGLVKDLLSAAYKYNSLNSNAFNLIEEIYPSL